MVVLMIWYVIDTVDDQSYHGCRKTPVKVVSS